MAGEIGVMFNIPQPFTVRSRGLSQVIRINHHHFKQMVQPFSDDGKAIMYNFIQVWKFTINWLINLHTSTLTKYHCEFIISKFCIGISIHTSTCSYISKLLVLLFSVFEGPQRQGARRNIICNRIAGWPWGISLFSISTTKTSDWL